MSRPMSSMSRALTDTMAASDAWLFWAGSILGSALRIPPKRSLPDASPDALLSLSRRRDAVQEPGFYAPVFPRGTPKAQTNDELRRLRARSPLRIAGPVFHDPDTDLLFLDEE